MLEHNTPMADFTQFDNTKFLIDLADQLQDTWHSGQEDYYTPELRAQMALLEEMARLNKCVYSLFDFEKYRYIFHTKNLFDLIGLTSGQKAAKWDSSYLSLIEDGRPIEKYLALRKQFLALLPADERTAFQSTTCGSFVINLKGQRLRGMYRAKPLTFDASGNVKLSFDSVSDVKNLMVAQVGYWIRFAASTVVYHWHSHTDKLIAKDIVSPREAQFIALWKAGNTIPEIAELTYVSPFTVKNQLANARARMLARDNTALTQLCSVTGILSTPF